MDTVLGAWSCRVKVRTGRTGVSVQKLCQYNVTRCRVISVTYTVVISWLPCQAPGVIGSKLGLVGPVSVYRNCVSITQHVDRSPLSPLEPYQ